MRHFNGRLVRKTLGFSKEVEMHKAAAAWEDLFYNLGRLLKSLSLPVVDDPVRRWQKRSPMMAAGLTDHIWTVNMLPARLSDVSKREHFSSGHDQN